MKICVVIKIRTSDVQDGPALSTLETSAWSPDVTPAPAREPGSTFFNERTRPEDVLVADADGRVIGYVMLHQSSPLASHSHVLEINGLAVDPAHQGHGVGRRLVQEAKGEAKRRGARKLSLRVLSQNVAARRLYESSGFAVEGVLKEEFIVQGQLIDDVLMACHLG
jgi:ribosomal protein S18 acetylase RimI-like enzyme